MSDETRVVHITSNLSEIHQAITPGKTVTTLWPLSLFDFTNSTGLRTEPCLDFGTTRADADSDYVLGEYELNDPMHLLAHKPVATSSECFNP